MSSSTTSIVETCRWVARMCVIAYMLLSLVVIASMVTGHSAYLSTAISKANLGVVVVSTSSLNDENPTVTATTTKVTPQPETSTTPKQSVEDYATFTKATTKVTPEQEPSTMAKQQSEDNDDAITLTPVQGTTTTAKEEETVVDEEKDTTSTTAAEETAYVEETKVSQFPVPRKDPYFGQLVEQGSLRSSDHQRKFLARKAQIASEFEPRLRFQSEPGEYASIVISDTFAFLHIWKCGGTTVAALTGGHQWRLDEKWIQNREWVGFVRDPIDRFLSAWAECGERQYKGENNFGGHEEHSTLNWLNDNYDFRVRAFLHEVIDFTFPNVWGSCHVHAHPQANFMINANGQIDQHVTIVGDLYEMKDVLKIAGFQNYTDKIKGRDSSANKVKSEYFPARRDLLHNQTILELCEFLVLDYYLFDFEPPEICVQEGGPLARFV